MRYFLKCCGFQELGSLGEDGKPKRGRYLMSSLHDEVVDFFPPLSISVPNDTALLAIVPLYTMSKTYASYVYHNSKYTGTAAKNPRNEYRIYLNAEVEDHQYYISAEDIVVMRKSESIASKSESEDQSVYYLDVIKDHSSGLYLQLSRIINDYPIRGGYGIYDGRLDYFEKKVSEYEAGKRNKDIQIDRSVTDRVRKSTSEKQENIFNPATFRDFVLSGYGNACAVSGQKAEGLFGEGLDVVYIKPLSCGGTSMPNNGIALTKDFSLLFVRGEFTLSDRFEIVVHPKSNNLLLKNYHLQQIRVPHNSFFQPDLTNIQYHRTNIFGAFLRTENDDLQLN